MNTIAVLNESLIGRYLVEKEIGQGGMATVYLARDVRHDRKVAIKVLKPELAAVLGADRFVQEIKTTAALSHPHILPLFDSGEVRLNHPERSDPPGRKVEGPAFALYYVMPYIEGETIRGKLNRETQFGIDEAVKITTEVADALDYAHRHGVVHRDIKPENILLHDGRPMVMDFGIALAVSAAAGGRMTETGLSLGTPHYMSPEQATADKEITGRSDIYSLGTVLYEMLSGQPPHLGGSAQQVIMKIVTEDAAPVTRLRKSVPPNVAAAVGRALEKLPADRFATAREFSDALANSTFPGSGTDPASAAGRSGALQEWIRNRWTWAALTTVLALAGGVFVISRGPRSGSPSFVPETFTPLALFNARFTPDGNSIVFSAATGDGPTPHLYMVRADHPDAEPIGPDSTHLLSVSSTNVLAVLTHCTFLHHRLFLGTLATLPIGGGAPRELAVNVREADWAPNGTDLAVVRDTNGIDQLEYPLGKVIAQTSGYFSDLRVSPSGDAIALFEHAIRNDDRGSVLILDRTGRPLARSEEFWAVEGLAWRPDGEAVLFGKSPGGSSAFAVFELGRRSRTREVLAGAGGHMMQDVARTGEWLVVRDEWISYVMGRGPGSPTAVNVGVRDLSGTPHVSGDGSLFLFLDAGVFGGPNYTVLMRKTDGSPPVRLGEGAPMAISPDRKFVLAVVPTKPVRLMLYPTGPGEMKQIDIGSFESIDVYGGSLAEVGGDLRFTFCGARPPEPVGCYLGSLRSGKIRSLAPAGSRLTWAWLSPDGSRFLTRVGDTMRIYPTEGGDAQPARGFLGGDAAVRWAPDGHDVWVYDREGRTMHVVRVNPETGVRTGLGSIAHPATSGLVAVGSLALADDPRVYAYSVDTYHSVLFLVKGMR